VAVAGLTRATFQKENRTMAFLPAERPIRAVALLPFATARLREELAALAGLELRWVTNGAELAEIVAGCDVALLAEALYDAAIARALAAPGRRTRWLALAAAGYGTVLHHGIPPDIVITNASPVWAPIVAEHAVALLLALLRQIPLLERKRATATWDRAGMVTNLAALEDQTVAIVGYGGIGKGIARRLRPACAELICFSRKPLGRDCRHRPFARCAAAAAAASRRRYPGAGSGRFDSPPFQCRSSRPAAAGRAPR
jgi:phosphoglycerate dehydrogenase-like enzyme